MRYYVLLVTLSACSFDLGGETTPISADAGAADAGAADAGPADADPSISDAAPPDAAPTGLPMWAECHPIDDMDACVSGLTCRLVHQEAPYGYCLQVGPVDEGEPCPEGLYECGYALECFGAASPSSWRCYSLCDPAVGCDGECYPHMAAGDGSVGVCL